ncbi:hypothetical protein F5877DRAFT_84865 [Lentinula edodes]|nr:hypothetical protein F5877DRAFT_84865 [Lentinula edodes]
MESQMAQSLADLRALREANLKLHQYLRQLLRRQEDNHAHLIAMETRMAMMEEEEEEEKEVEEKENAVEKDGEGEEETAPTEARSEKGKERAE